MRILFDDQAGDERTMAALTEKGELSIEQETLLGDFCHVWLTPEQVTKLIAALTKEPRGEERREMILVPAIQVLSDHSTLEEASKVFDFQVRQIGYLGGRLLPPGDIFPMWRCQTFHSADGVEPSSWLPDGMRYGLVPDYLLRTKGEV